MARPLKRTVDYFPHFVTAGKTLLILQNEFGNDGYAFWFKLLSLLCKTDGQVYDYNNPAAWRLLLAETCVNEDIANRVLQLLSDIEAIDPALYLKKIIWVQNLVDNLGEVYTRRKNGVVPTKPVIVSRNPKNVNKNTQTRPDHTKPNQTKGEERDTTPSPVESSVLKIFLEKFPYAFGREPNSREQAQLRDFAAEVAAGGGATEKQIHDAFKEAVGQNKCNVRYVRAVLLDWLGVPR